MAKFTVYTDGGAHNEPGDNKGIGASAWLTTSSNIAKIIDVYVQYHTDTTNNRTEMIAAINAIDYIDYNIDPELRTDMHIISDSGYLVNGYTNPSYLDKWVKNGWVTSSKKPVLNRDLWEKLMNRAWHVGLTFSLIKGHKKDPNRTHAYWNDICDKACTYVMENYKYTGFLYKLHYDIEECKFVGIDTEIMHWDHNKPHLSIENGE